MSVNPTKSVSHREPIIVENVGTQTISTHTISTQTNRDNNIAAATEDSCSSCIFTLFQMTGAFLASPFCFPCAAARLCGDCTELYDPKCVPGPERFVWNKEYYDMKDEIKYNESPGDGVLSQKAVDISTIAGVSLWGAVIGVPVGIGLAARMS